MKWYQKAVVYGTLAASPFLASLSKAQPMAEARMGGAQVENTKIKSAAIKDSRITWTTHYDLSGKLLSPKTSVEFGKVSSHDGIANYQIIGSISSEIVPLAIDSTKPGAALEIRTHLVYAASALNGGNIQAVIDEVKGNVVNSGGRQITQMAIMDYPEINFADSLHYWMVKTFTNVGQDGKALSNTDVIGMGKPFSTSYAKPFQQGKIKELTAVEAPFAISKEREYDSTNVWIGYKEVKISFAWGGYAPGTPPTIITPVAPGFEATEVTGVHERNAPEGISLSAYPNPVASGQPINYSISISKEMNLSVGIYDVLGRKVATVAEGKYRQGTYNLAFGDGLAPGFYLTVLKADGKVHALKNIVVQ